MDAEDLRTLLLPLPGVEEDIKWDNDLVFSVAGKMFCASALQPPFKISFKVPEDDFEELCNRPGFMPAPYLARAKWVAVTDAGCLHRDQWHYFLLQSYELVIARLPKKTREMLG